MQNSQIDLQDLYLLMARTIAEVMQISSEQAIIHKQWLESIMEYSDKLWQGHEKIEAILNEVIDYGANQEQK